MRQVRSTTRRLGLDRLDTFVAWQALAMWQGKARDAAMAAETSAALLDDAKRVFGPDHPHTVTTRRELARWQATSAESGDGDTF